MHLNWWCSSFDFCVYSIFRYIFVPGIIINKWKYISIQADLHISIFFYPALLLTWPVVSLVWLCSSGNKWSCTCTSLDKKKRVMSKLLYNVYEKSSSPRNLFISREGQFKLQKLETAWWNVWPKWKRHAVNMNMKTWTQTEPKIARNLIVPFMCSLQCLLPNNVTSKCINKESHLVWTQICCQTTCALSFASCKDSHNLHLFSAVEQVLSHEQEMRFS